MSAAGPHGAQERPGESPGAPGAAGAQGSGPIFVVGMPRSGTTLMTAMLNAHPAVTAGPETHFFSFLTARLRRLPRGARAVAVAPAVRDPAIREALAGADRRAGTRLWPLLPSAARRLLAGVLRGPDDRADDRAHAVPVEKTPAHLEYLPLVHALYPRARVVVMQRDPRAVYASLKKVPWFTSSLPKICARWCFYQRHAARASAARAEVRVIPYEELVADPEAVLTRLQAWLGLTLEPLWARYLENAGSVYVADQESWKRNADRPVDADRAHAWRSELQPAEIRRIESLAGGCMQRCGYAPVAPPSRPRLADLLRMRVTGTRLRAERAGVVAVSWWYGLVQALAGRAGRG